MIVVTAATGNIGSGLVAELLKKGKKVRAVARGADKLKSLEKQGAEPFAADVQDAAAVARAFAGAEAAFTLIPPQYDAADFRAYQNKVADAYIAAIQKAGIKRVVNLSSVGGHLADGAGPINGLHDGEERLNKLAGVSVLHLRPAFFMENFFFNVGLMKAQGIAGSPMRADLRFPMIATRDISRVAAERLLKADFSGKSVQELLGPRDMTMTEAIGLIGAAIGRSDLKYVLFPYEDARKAMMGQGMSADMARLFVEMYQGFNDGRVKPVEARSPKNTTPTSMEDFAKIFAEVYSRS